MNTSLLVVPLINILLNKASSTYNSLITPLKDVLRIILDRTEPSSIKSAEVLIFALNKEKLLKIKSLSLIVPYRLDSFDVSKKSIKLRSTEILPKFVFTTYLLFNRLLL